MEAIPPQPPSRTAAVQRGGLFSSLLAEDSGAEAGIALGRRLKESPVKKLLGRAWRLKGLEP